MLGILSCTFPTSSLFHYVVYFHLQPRSRLLCQLCLLHSLVEDSNNETTPHIASELLDSQECGGLEDLSKTEKDSRVHTDFGFVETCDHTRESVHLLRNDYISGRFREYETGRTIIVSISRTRVESFPIIRRH